MDSELWFIGSLQILVVHGSPGAYDLVSTPLKEKMCISSAKIDVSYTAKTIGKQRPCYCR